MKQTTNGMTSIRGFLFRLLLATTILTLFVSVLQGYQAGSKEIQQQMDTKLVDLARLISNLPLKDSSADAAIQAGDPFSFQIFSSEKDLLHHSTTTTRHQIAPLKPGFNERNFNGYRWRTYGFFNTSNKRWVIVAERLDVRFYLAEKIILKSLMPIVIEIPVAAVLIWFIIGHGLKPLYQLSSALRNKPDNDLSVLQIKQPYAEVEQVVQSTNNLLRQLSQSVEREKRFSSDVAHELRTPLSVLKIDLFNLSRKSTIGSSDILALNRGVSRMEHLVQQILTLQRTTSDQFVARFAPHDLLALTQKVIADHYERIDSKSQSIELHGTHCLLDCDQASLEILLTNLINNANKYTPSGGSIRINLHDSDHSVVLQIEDSGSGIAESMYERVFERFYRLDGDCHASSEAGCGIGLSIVKHIVALHKARISLHHSCFETGLLVQINFPKNQGIQNS